MTAGQLHKRGGLNTAIAGKEKQHTKVKQFNTNYNELMKISVLVDMETKKAVGQHICIASNHSYAPLSAINNGKM